MIDENEITSIEQLLILYPNGTHFIVSEQKSGLALNAETLQELVHLARLGLWAQKHAIPALHDVVELAWYNELDENGNLVRTLSKADFAKDALAALSTDEE